MSSSNRLRYGIATKIGLVGVLVAGLLTLPSPARTTVAAQESAGERPNIVVIMTDDQTVESLRVMPAVRRLLGRQGTKFTQSFASYPLCCPSRASFLTGQYSHNNGVTFNYAPYGGWQAFAEAAPTAFPVALQQAGYDTAHFGKVMNEYGAEDPHEVPPGWTHWEAQVDRPVRNRYYGFRFNRNGRLHTAEASARFYNTDFFARRARSYIRERADQADPFFLNLWLFGPHGEQGNGPSIPADRHVGMFADEPLPNSPSINEADMSDKPLHLQRDPLGPKKLARARQRYQWRLESLLAVDDAVSDLVDTLRATDQMKNTVVVFTSDNGFLHGEHRVPMGKWHVYDEATRVPLLMRGPGIPADRRIREPVLNIDIGPTLLDFANAAPLNVPDGRSLRPLLSGTVDTFDRDLLFTTGFGKADRWYTAIRTDDYLYVEHVQDRSGSEIFAEELYDLADDPHQLRSLHAHAAHEETRAALQERLHRLRACAGTTCHTRSQLPPPDEGGHTVPKSQIDTGGPVDDPESYPNYFSTYDETAPTPNADAAEVGVALTAADSRLDAGDTARFRAKVTVDGSAAPGQSVILRRRIRGTLPWIDVGTASTNDRGVVKFTPDVTADATWRARVEATKQQTSGRSEFVDVAVAPVVTSRLSDGVVRAGDRMVLRGSVAPARRGQRVVLQRRIAGTWIDVDHTSLDARSAYEFRFRAVDGVNAYRVVKPATATLRAGRGRVHRLSAYRVGIARLVANPQGPDAENLEGEIVVVRNRGLAPVRLARWMVLGERSGRWAKLPRYTLDPDSSVRISTGAGTAGAGHIYLDEPRPLWANTREQVHLYDDEGALAAAGP